MSQSLAKIYLHIVFSTKNRLPFLSDAAVRREVHGYLAGACHNLGAPSLIVGGVEDHVHIACYMSRTRTVAWLVGEIKRESSRWIKAKDNSLGSFGWQNGYGAFSISPSHLDALRAYIADQERHHRLETFQDEYRRLLKKYELEYDDQFLWE